MPFLISKNQVQNVSWEKEKRVRIKNDFALKVMLHGTSSNNGFRGNTALQYWDNVVTIRNNVATMLQPCVVLTIAIANRLV